MRRSDGGSPGITSVQYGLILAVVGVLLLAGFYVLFTSVGERFSESGQCVAASCPPSGGGPGGPVESSTTTVP